MCCLILLGGITTTLPSWETLCHGISVSGVTCSEVQHGRLPSTCVMDARRPSPSYQAATQGTTGLAALCRSSWTVRTTWPTTDRPACWRTSALWAATTYRPWARTSDGPCFWTAPSETSAAWLSSGWPNTSARPSIFLSVRSIWSS